MNNFKFLKTEKGKVIAAIVLFLLFVGGLSYAVYLPFGSIYNNSNRYDTAFIGASQIRRGIRPDIIDSRLGTNSIDYSCAGCTAEGKYSMLKSALEQDSLHTVVLDMSYGALAKHREDYVFEEEILCFPRISGLFNKLEVARRDFSFSEDEYDRLYAELLYEGSKDWEKILKGTYINYKSRKGYSPRQFRDQLIKTEAERKELYNSEQLNTDFPDYNFSILADAIALCREKNVHVILITVPVSQRFLWINDGLDTFRTEMETFAAQQDVEYYDFNLLENLSEYFSDEDSFYDLEHCSRRGAKTFSKIMARALTASENGQPCPYTFYKTYEEAKKHLIYAPLP